MARFTPRIRKHKQIARAKAASTSNTNQEVIIPESQSEREARRHAIQQELRSAQPESKISSKKRKRQDKYIETKLRKEENAELLKKLEAQKVDTSLLQSSKQLGRVKESRREKLSRALREQAAGVGVEAEQEKMLYQRRRDGEDTESRNGETSDEADDIELEVENGPGVIVRQQQHLLFGSGLKRPLDVDEEGQPIIKKRRKRNKKSMLPQTNGHISTEQTDEDEENEEVWEGCISDIDDEDAAKATSTAAVNPDGVSYTSDGSDQGHYDNEVDQGNQEGGDVDIDSESSTRPGRISAIKAWMDSKRNDALGFTPSSTLVSATATANFKPRAPSPDPILESISAAQASNTVPRNLDATVTILRTAEIQAARLHLPVVQEEQKIMEAVNLHPVVVVCGATGSGKTTQVPQMLLENGYGSRVGIRDNPGSGSVSPLQSKGMIGVTQPRRIAATSVATRVKHELGIEYGRRVAHQIRYDSNVGRDTAIKFMTDGILLREIQKDFLLPRYSVIVLDEAHERDVNTDVLIGLLARILPVRAKLAEREPEKHCPLKLIIMSATLSHGAGSFLQNAQLWKPFGGPPPVVEAEGRQYPVTEHFSRRTRRDYVDEMVDKVARGHRKLPQGGMLVFLTGQQEIQTVARRLQQRLGGSSYLNGHNKRAVDVDDYEDGIVGVGAEKNDYLEGEEELSDVDSEAEIRLDANNDAEFAIDDVESPSLHQSTAKGALKPHILPLYAALPADQQARVFNPPPPGTRLIVIATNVAETSLTIPNIRYVFDCGRVKENKYATSTGIQTFEVDWISKAAAEQRKGRAGRTAAGHVWRLYSSAVFEEFFAEETTPEILRTPLESTILQLKMIEGLSIATFPFPTMPEKDMLDKAEVLLRNLGAIHKNQRGAITDLGRSILKFPVNPRYGKMLWLAQCNRVVGLAVALVAGLAVGDLFVPEVQGKDISVAPDLGLREDDIYRHDIEASRDRVFHAQAAAEDRKRLQEYTSAQAQLSSADELSDAIKVLASILAYADHDGKSDFCKRFWLREKRLAEVQMLRRQLHSIAANSGISNGLPGFQENIPKPPEKELKILKEIVAAGYIDQVAIRADALPESDLGFGRKPRRAIEVPYRTLVPSAEHDVGQAADPVEQEFRRSVFVHPSSVLARLSPNEMPTYVVYSHLSRAAPPVVASASLTKKTRMHPLTAIGPKSLARLAEGTPLLRFGKPLHRIEDLPRDAKNRQRRQCWVNVALKAPESGGVEWPLNIWKVVQVRGDRDWEVEKVLAC